MLIYEFVYTDSIFESGMVTLSVHKTKKGAYNAMREFLEKKYAEWRESGIRYGKQEYKFGTHCAWNIRPIELRE